MHNEGVEVLKQIYNHLADEKSREIFENRVLYSITNKPEFIQNIVLEIPEGQEFFSRLKKASSETELVIFGAGFWGTSIISATKDYAWKCFIDNNPKTKIHEEIPVLSFTDFMKNYNGETIVVSSRIHYVEMYQQLIDNGISEKSIINAGELIDLLSKKQYFDLEAMTPACEGEVFVDVGAFDGKTSLEFFGWCNGNGFVYAFEPDGKNQQKLSSNLEQDQVPYEIVPKGAWSEKTTLYFEEKSNGTSCITDTVSERNVFEIPVTTLDEVFKNTDRIATFVKMDIEGSELEALKGARGLIEEHRPKLAISIYHKDEDIWELPKLILKYKSDYKFYLRHYSLTSAETVLYAI
ncbi:methyltransferase FkbM [Lachnospiraceae bacterium KM106-2]|nr:methyltransferase FkbM [Lachnospiraceae bacterium KM106-2]